MAALQELFLKPQVACSLNLRQLSSCTKGQKDHKNRRILEPRSLGAQNQDDEFLRFFNIVLYSLVRYMLFDIILCCTLLYFVLHHIRCYVLHYTIPYHVFYCILLCCIVSCCITRIIFFYVLLPFIVLYFLDYIVFYYIFASTLERQRLYVRAVLPMSCRKPSVWKE